MTAGPSFELFYETDYLMPHREAAWALLEERLRDAVAFCRKLQGDAGEPLVTELGPIGDALGEIADSLASHFGDWGARSRFAKPAAENRPVCQGSRVAAVAVRANTRPRLLPRTRRTRRRSAGEPRSRRRRCLLDRRSAGSYGSLDRRDSRNSAVLPSGWCRSVLRPLAEAIAGPERSDACARQRWRDAWGYPGCERRVGRCQAVWTLARQRASLQRASGGRRPSARAASRPTAALQDLALQSAKAVGAAEVQERMTQLKSMQSSLRLPDSVLGKRPLPRHQRRATSATGWASRFRHVPQMALCRCGESSHQADLRRTHAEIGFSDARDPKRVARPARHLRGQQVTIFDNRGICQHSGFCTDRLATVFHTRAIRSSRPAAAGWTRSSAPCATVPRVRSATPSTATRPATRSTITAAASRRSRSPRTAPTGSRAYRAPRRTKARRAPPRAPRASTTRCAAADTPRTSPSAAACTGTSTSATRAATPAPADLYEWAADCRRSTRMTRLFYEKVRAEDPLLAPLFADMSADHPVASPSGCAEVFWRPAPLQRGVRRLQDALISQHSARLPTRQPGPLGRS